MQNELKQFLPVLRSIRGLGGCEMFWFFVFLILGILLVAGLVQAANDNEKMSKMPPAQKAEFQATQAHGPVNRQMICPHCQERGKVHTKKVTQRKGVSGGKATGAILTGGVSLLATGLSRKENATEAFCRNCSSTWYF